MKTGLRARIRFADSLGFRLAVLLSLALLPIGVISVVQGVRTLSEAQRIADAALIGRTAEAAAAERALMLTTFGAAEGLVESILALHDDPEACSAMLAGFVRQSGIVSFAGFTGADGFQRCFSRGHPIDARATPYFQRMDALRTPWVGTSAVGLQTGEPVVTVRWPVNVDETWLGYLVLSIPQRTIERIRGLGPEVLTPNLVTFNQFGELLTTGDASDEATAERLPQGRDLATLAQDAEQTFRALNQRGETRIFTVAPVIQGQVFALGSWTPSNVLLSGGMQAAILYPLLMWIASLGVAWFAVHRLVIRHIRELRGQMRRFALGRRDVPPDVLTGAPAEIQDVSQTFHNLARILIRDEAELESSLAEKTVLLKEVHHRVKNNLQLIASIMNMQIRRVKEPSARRVLKSVQDRVMSLATIHRSLYTAERLSAVPVDELLAEIANQMIVLGGAPGEHIEVRADFAPVTLTPDQAVPLALLATEAVTNAMKYIGRPADGSPPAIGIALAVPAEGRVRFAVENTCGAPVRAEEGGDASTGLGTQLIQAFVTQLEGTLEVETSADGAFYRLAIDFPSSPADSET